MGVEVAGVSCTHSLSVDRMHSEEECCDKGQARVLKDAPFTRVHEQTGHDAVQTQVDDVEIQRRHAPQHDVQPDSKKRQEDTFSSVARDRSCICVLADQKCSKLIT